MGLKSRNWFLGKCLSEERGRTRLAYLGAKALDLGLTGNENTRSHILHACGATQMFFTTLPRYKVIIRQSPTDIYKPEGDLLRAWLRFLSPKSGNYGQRDFGYSWDTLKSCLTRKYGGVCSGGGGGDNELEIVLRLMAEFV